MAESPRLFHPVAAPICEIGLASAAGTQRISQTAARSPDLAASRHLAPDHTELFAADRWWPHGARTARLCPLPRAIDNNRSPLRTQGAAGLDSKTSVEG